MNLPGDGGECRVAGDIGGGGDLEVDAGEYCDLGGDGATVGIVAPESYPEGGGYPVSARSLRRAGASGMYGGSEGGG